MAEGHIVPFEERSSTMNDTPTTQPSDHHSEPGNMPPTEGITYTVDGEAQTTTEKVLTARQILTSAGIEPATHYLKLLRGESDQESSYAGRMDEPIHMHPKMRFIAPSIGSTPVS